MLSSILTRVKLEGSPMRKCVKLFQMIKKPNNYFEKLIIIRII